MPLIFCETLAPDKPDILTSPSHSFSPSKYTITPSFIFTMARKIFPSRQKLDKCLYAAWNCMSSHSIRPPYLPGTSLTNPWYRYLFSPHFKLYTESSNSRGRERFPPIDRPHPASTTSARALPSLLRQLPLERRILRMFREKSLTNRHRGCFTSTLRARERVPPWRDRPSFARGLRSSLSILTDAILRYSTSCMSK